MYQERLLQAALGTAQDPDACICRRKEAQGIGEEDGGKENQVISGSIETEGGAREGNPASPHVEADGQKLDRRGLRQHKRQDWEQCDLGLKDPQDQEQQLSRPDQGFNASLSAEPTVSSELAEGWSGEHGANRAQAMPSQDHCAFSQVHALLSELHEHATKRMAELATAQLQVGHGQRRCGLAGIVIWSCCFKLEQSRNKPSKAWQSWPWRSSKWETLLGVQSCWSAGVAV